MKREVFFLLFTLNLVVSPYLLNAQPPRLVLPVGHVGNVTNAVFSPDGKWVLTSSEDGTAKVWNAATGLLVVDLEGVSNEVNSASFSPDGKSIVMSSYDSTVKVLNAATGELTAILKGHTSMVTGATFSPDGKLIVTASYDKTARVWNAVTGQLILVLKGHTGFVNSAAFSPDGKFIVTASYDKTARVWNAASGKLIADLKGHTGSVKSATFSPDGKLIVTAASMDNIARVWSVTSGKLVFDLKGHTRDVLSAVFSPDGKSIVTASLDRTTKVWNTATGQLVTDLEVPANYYYYIESAAFSPDGKLIVIISDDSTAKVWNVANRELVANLKGHNNVVNSAVFSPDGKLIVTASMDNTARIWNASTGQLVADLKGHTSAVNSASFSPDGKSILTDSWGSMAKVWNAATGQLAAYLKGPGNRVYKTSFSPDGKWIVTIFSDNTDVENIIIMNSAEIWNARTGQLVADLRGHTGSVNNASFSPDGKCIVTASDDSTAKVWTIASGQLLSDLKGNNGYVDNASFSPDGKLIVTSSTDKTAKVWNVAGGKLLANLKGLAFDCSAVFSPDGKLVVTSAAYDTTPRIWNAATGELIAELKGHTSLVRTLEFSPDAKLIVTASADRTAKVWQAATGQLVTTLSGHTDIVFRAVFSPDGKFIVTASYDGTAKVWKTATGELIADLKGLKVRNAAFSPDGKWVVTLSTNESEIRNAANGSLLKKIYGEKNETFEDIDFVNNRIESMNKSAIGTYDMETGKKLYSSFAIDSLDYLNQIPSGYYMCTPNAARLLHYVTNDLKVITFEQLDVKYNRPDLVLNAIGCPDTSLIQLYKKAWQKRITKLGFDTSLFTGGLHVPDADIQNRDSVQYEQTSGKLSLKITTKDDSVMLDRYNVWINEVPLFGVKGISLKSRNTKYFDTTITVTLSNGPNRIETSVTNVGGLESYRAPLDVKYTAPQPVKEKLYFIGIGIDHFNDNRYDLSWSVKDIRNLAHNFKKKYGQDCIIDTLFDKDVSTENVKTLKQRLLATTENDKVIVAYSGHGLLSKDYDYFLSAYNVNFQEPEKGGLPYETLEDLLDGIRARKKLMLIDACHSGEVDKEELSKMVQVQAKLDSTQKGVIVFTDTTDKRTGMKNSFDLMQEVFVNVGRSTGATVISAAAGTQFALERGDLKNGVFTYSILELMKKNTTVTISELKKYVNQRVTELTNGMQVPTSRDENNELNWKVW